MEPVAFDAHVVEALRQREMARRFRHGAMKGRVEAGVLLRVGQELFGLADELKGRGDMNGCKLRGGLQLLHQRFVDQLVLAQMRTTVDNAMTNGRGRSVTEAMRGIEDFLEGVALGVEFVRLVEERFGLRILNLQTAVGMADARRAAGEQQLRTALAGRMPVETELQRRRTAVDGEDDFFAGGSCGLITHQGQVQLRISGLSMPQVCA